MDLSHHLSHLECLDQHYVMIIDPSTVFHQKDLNKLWFRSFHEHCIKITIFKGTILSASWHLASRELHEYANSWGTWSCGNSLVMGKSLENQSIGANHSKSRLVKGRISSRPILRQATSKSTVSPTIEISVNQKSTVPRIV